jgi:hypothetical protein
MKDSIKQLQSMQIERAKNALADMETQDTQEDIFFVPSSYSRSSSEKRIDCEVIELDGTDDEEDVKGSPTGPFTVTTSPSPYEESLAPPIQRLDIFSRYVLPKDSNSMMGSTKTASSSSSSVHSTEHSKSEKSYFTDTRKSSAVETSQREAKRSRTKSTDKNGPTGNAFASTTTSSTSNPFERFGFTVFK